MWLLQQRNAKGDIVRVMDRHTAIAHWPLGRVLMTYPGKDDAVRIVEV